jgi:hypothetical protein
MLTPDPLAQRHRDAGSARGRVQGPHAAHSLPQGQAPARGRPARRPGAPEGLPRAARRRPRAEPGGYSTLHCRPDALAWRCGSTQGHRRHAAAALPPRSTCRLCRLPHEVRGARVESQVPMCGVADDRISLSTASWRNAGSRRAASKPRCATPTSLRVRATASGLSPPARPRSSSSLSSSECARPILLFVL